MFENYINTSEKQIFAHLLDSVTGDNFVTTIYCSGQLTKASFKMAVASGMQRQAAALVDTFRESTREPAGPTKRIYIALSKTTKTEVLKITLHQKKKNYKLVNTLH